MEGGDFIQKIGGVVCKKCQTEICDCPRDSETAKAQGKEARVDVIKNFTVFQ
jgi:Ca2+ transporting ATPase